MRNHQESDREAQERLEVLVAEGEERYRRSVLGDDARTAWQNAREGRAKSAAAKQGQDCLNLVAEALAESEYRHESKGVHIQ